MSSWHIWAIQQHKFDVIKSYLERELPEVTDVFFPTTIKEKRLGKRIYKSRLPLYHGYLFIKYVDLDNRVFHKLKSNPFITTHVGICTDKDVELMRQKEEWNVLKKEIETGNEIEIMCGPMIGNRGVVEAINGNKITIKTKLFGREVTHTLSADDIEIIAK